MRSVVILAYPGVQSLDVTGPGEVLGRSGGYRVEVVAPQAGRIRARSGLELYVERSVAEVDGPVDTLLIAGGEGVDDAIADPEVIRHVRRLAATSRRVTSVCTGALLLAAAGLLDGRRATTHWAYCQLLAQRHPGVEVQPDAIYVRDGEVWTSAGVTAGIDLALALVEADLGPDVALQVARRLVVFLKRPGGQSQFSAQLAGQFATREPLRDLQGWILDHLDEDLSVGRLAGRVAMSPRHFSRAFRAEVGVTPARYVEHARVDAARRLLSESTASVDQIARRCGFGTAETMRRTFLRNLATTPTDYRGRFPRIKETA